MFVFVKKEGRLKLMETAFEFYKFTNIPWGNRLFET